MSGRQYGRWTSIEYARFADDLVILVDAHPRHRWIRGAIQRRLREELAKIEVTVNEEKTRFVDLSKTESFGSLIRDWVEKKIRRPCFAIPNSRCARSSLRSLFPFAATSPMTRECCLSTGHWVRRLIRRNRFPLIRGVPGRP
jgi:hypothetical protein